MRKMLTVSAMLLASVVSSHAFPASTVTNSTAPNVEYVANGCGIGWHRGPGGFCRRNAAVVVAPRAVVVAPAPVVVAPVAPVVVAPRVCPPGFHLGPAGRACRPN